MKGMRITRALVEAKVNNCNRLMGYDPETVTWNTIGALSVQGAYGGYRVERVSSESGGTSPLGSHGFGTLRQCADILDGFRECLLIMSSHHASDCHMVADEMKVGDTCKQGDARAFHHDQGRMLTLLFPEPPAVVEPAKPARPLRRDAIDIIRQLTDEPQHSTQLQVLADWHSRGAVEAALTRATESGMAVQVDRFVWVRSPGTQAVLDRTCCKPTITGQHMLECTAR